MDAMVETHTADREIVIERIFDAPRALVWEAWTHPEHVAEWWGPDGFTTTIQRMDFREGGVWKLVMHGPDGTDYPNSSVFREIVVPERIVFSHGGGREGGPGAHFLSTWTFEALGERTRLTIRMLFDTADARDLVVREYGAVEGGRQTLARLAGYLPRMADKPGHLTISRSFDAPRELVWQAWTDPDHLSRWWGPHGFTASRCQWDSEPGKANLVHMRGPEGSPFDFDMPMGGRFEEVHAPERLVFITTAMPDDHGRPQLEVRHTVTFAEEQGGTRITMQAVVLRSAPGAADAVAGMEQGWSESLEKLADHLGGI